MAFPRHHIQIASPPGLEAEPEGELEELLVSSSEEKEEEELEELVLLHSKHLDAAMAAQRPSPTQQSPRKRFRCRVMSALPNVQRSHPQAQLCGLSPKTYRRMKRCRLPTVLF